MMAMEPRTLVEKGTTIVFGVDQSTFTGGANEFCLGHPLMVEETGELLDADAFQNRGRLWWMVNDVDTSDLVPGTLHTAQIEDAPAFDPGDQEKDAYQVKRRGRLVNSERWVEVLCVPGKAPRIDELMTRGVALEQRPWKQVLLEYENCVLGPFTAIWGHLSRRATLRKSGGDCRTHRFAPSTLSETNRLVEIRWETNRFDRSAGTSREIVTRLFRQEDLRVFFGSEAWIDITPLGQIARTLAKRLQTADSQPLHAKTSERLSTLVEVSGDEQDREWVERLEAALFDLREGSGLAQDFPPNVRAALQSFLPPRAPASPPEPDASPAPSSQSARTGVRAVMEETTFLRQLQSTVDATPFHFDESDLVAFHLGLKAGPWSVLAGSSGTGKSTLPRLYAKALGDDESLLKVSVRPDWLDDRDVIGSWDVLSRRFVPAPTGLVDFLIRAAEDLEAGKAGPRLILLDEMNLARVEYYFASFLSILELPPQDRILSLFSSRIADAEDPYTPHANLVLPPNIRIVGTVNVDETTHFFSPKVLDRAGVQMFGRPDLLAGAGAHPQEESIEVEPVDWSTWNGWIANHRQAENWISERLNELNDVLVMLHSGMGHRVFQRCLRFVAGAQGLDEFISTKGALDLAIMLYVLPRLRTDSSAFSRIGDTLLDVLPESELPSSRKLVQTMLDSEERCDFWQLL
jgi:hypothetical protein